MREIMQHTTVSAEGPQKTTPTLHLTVLLLLALCAIIIFKYFKHYPDSY